MLGRNVRIERLTIIGGRSSGVVISRGGSARMLNSVVSGAGRDGIIATRGTYVEVRRTEVKDNGRYGIFVRNSSSADIHLNDIHGNGDGNDAGVYISNSSSADIDGNDIHDNLGDGVLLTRASSVSFSSDPSVSPPSARSNRINDNGDAGIACFSNSAYRVAIDQTLQGNVLSGTRRSKECSARVANNGISCPPSFGGPSLTIPTSTAACP